MTLTAKGLTTGEVPAHLAEVYGAEVPKDTISNITDRVPGEMADWQARPLDPIYPVIFIDAIHVKIRDGKVANLPIYTAVAVTTDGERDILGLWVGDGGEGAKTSSGRADLCAAPHPPHLPPRRPPTLGRHRPGAPARLHRAHRGRRRGTLRRVHQHLG